jgi:hypothetical protein
MRAFDWQRCWAPWKLAAVPASVRAHRVGCGASDAHFLGLRVTMLCNDAYGVVVGCKHPGAFGRSCREVFAEAWDFIGPHFDSV